MPLEFIYLNSPPVVAVNCDNRKAMGKEKWHKVKFEKSTKNDSIEFRKKKRKAWQNGNQVLNQQIPKMEVVKVVKNWKVINYNILNNSNSNNRNNSENDSNAYE